MEPYHLHSLSNSSSSSFSLPSDLRSWACNELRVLCGDSEDLDASLIDEFLSFISLSPSSLAPSSTHLAESRQHAAEGRTRQSEREDDDGEEEEQEEEEERKREEEVKDLASFIECLVAPLRHDFSPHVQAEISSFSSLFSSRLRSAYQAHLSSRESPRKPLLASSSSSSSSSSPPRSPPSPHVSGAEKNDKRSISLDRRELAVNQEEEEDLKEGEVSSSSSPLRVTVTSPKEQESAGEMHTKKKKNNAPSDDGERGREQKGDVREEREEESIFEKVVERNERRSPESLGEKRKDKKGRDDERKEEERNMRVSSDSKEGVRDVHQPSAVYTPQVHKKPSSSVYHYSSSPRNSPNPSSRDPFLSPSADSSSSCSSSHLPEKEEPSSPSSSFAFPHTAAQNDYLHGYHTPLEEEKREESPLSGPEAETLVVKKKKKRRPAVTLDSFGISNIPYHTPQTSSSRNRDTSSQDDLPASSSSSSAITATRRKKQAKKFSIYSLEGDVYRRKRSHRENSQSSSSSLGVRCICLCMGTEHGVYGSCLYCGKVACEMEGGRDCLFCGNAIKVYSSQFQKGAKKKKKHSLEEEEWGGRRERLGGKRQVMKRREGGGDQQRRLRKGRSEEEGEEHEGEEEADDGEDEGWLEEDRMDVCDREERERVRQKRLAALAKAIDLKNRLVEFDRTSAVRSIVHDDATDWYEEGGNVWIDAQKRAAALQEHEKYVQQKAQDKKRAYISIDLVNRQVHDESGRREEEREEDMLRNLQAFHLECAGDRPSFSKDEDGREERERRREGAGEEDEEEDNLGGRGGVLPSDGSSEWASKKKVFFFLDQNKQKREEQLTELKHPHAFPPLLTEKEHRREKRKTTKSRDTSPINEKEKNKMKKKKEEEEDYFASLDHLHHVKQTAQRKAEKRWRDEADDEEEEDDLLCDDCESEEEEEIEEEEEKERDCLTNPRLSKVSKRLLRELHKIRSEGRKASHANSEEEEERPKRGGQEEEEERGEMSTSSKGEGNYEASSSSASAPVRMMESQWKKKSLQGRLKEIEEEERKERERQRNEEQDEEEEKKRMKKPSSHPNEEEEEEDLKKNILVSSSSASSKLDEKKIRSRLYQVPEPVLLPLSNDHDGGEEEDLFLHLSQAALIDLGSREVGDSHLPFSSAALLPPSLSSSSLFSQTIFREESRAKKEDKEGIEGEEEDHGRSSRGQKSSFSFAGEQEEEEESAWEYGADEEEEEDEEERREREREKGSHSPLSVSPSLASRVMEKEQSEGLCLTVKQPYASLIIHGLKTIEGRNWMCRHRGRLWIHASASRPDASSIESAKRFYMQLLLFHLQKRKGKKEADTQHGDEEKYTEKKNKKSDKISTPNSSSSSLSCSKLPSFPQDFPTSAILGCVTLVDCIDKSMHHEKDGEKRTEEEKKKKEEEEENLDPEALILSSIALNESEGFSHELLLQRPRRLAVPVKVKRGEKGVWCIDTARVAQLETSLLAPRWPRILSDLHRKRKMQKK